MTAANFRNVAQCFACSDDFGKSITAVDISDYQTLIVNGGSPSYLTSQWSGLIDDVHVCLLPPCKTRCWRPFLFICFFDCDIFLLATLIAFQNSVNIFFCLRCCLRLISESLQTSGTLFDYDKQPLLAQLIAKKQPLAGNVPHDICRHAQHTRPADATLLHNNFALYQVGTNGFQVPVRRKAKIQPTTRTLKVLVEPKARRNEFGVLIACACIVCVQRFILFHCLVEQPREKRSFKFKCLRTSKLCAQNAPMKTSQQTVLSNDCVEIRAVI